MTDIETITLFAIMWISYFVVLLIGSELIKPKTLKARFAIALTAITGAALLLATIAVTLS